MAGKEECDATVPPKNLPYFSLSLSLIFLLFSVPGNILVCFVVYKDPRKDLRSPFTFLLVNLALADLIAGGITDFAAAVFTIQEIQNAVPTLALVYVTHLSLFISCTASVLTLVALTLDRSCAISRPLRYRANWTTRKAKMVSVFIWTSACSLPWLYLRVGYISYLFVFANTAVLMASFIFLIAYTKIFRTLRARTKEIHAMQGLESQDNHNQRLALLLEKKITKTYLLMVAAFMFSYAPSCALIYVLNFCSICPCAMIHWSRDIVFFLILLNSSVNPFLYAWRLQNFRRAFLTVVSCVVADVVSSVSNFSDQNMQDTDHHSRLALQPVQSAPLSESLDIVHYE